MKLLIEVHRGDIETISILQAMGTWEFEKYMINNHFSYDIWSFNGELYKIYKDSIKPDFFERYCNHKTNI